MNAKQMFEQGEFEEIRVEDDGRMYFPDSTARILLLSEYGKVPKKKRLYKKRLKIAVHKALVYGLERDGVDVGKLRRYM